MPNEDKNKGSKSDNKSDKGGIIKEGGITPSKPVTSKPPQGGSGISGDSKKTTDKK